MDKDSLRLVDFDKIINRLEALAFTKGGKSKAQGLLPLQMLMKLKLLLEKRHRQGNF